MKKLISIFTLFLFSFCIISCNMQDAKYINLSTKPNNHYYTDQLSKKILENQDFNVYIFDTNLYKEILIEPENNSIIENFLTSLSSEDFISEKTNTKETYRLKIVFNDNSKYVIKVFNSTLATLSPWDGNYDEDIISMKNLPLRYNLLDFCTHVQNKPISK